MSKWYVYKPDKSYLLEVRSDGEVLWWNCPKGKRGWSASVRLENIENYGILLSDKAQAYLVLTGELPEGWEDAQ